MKKEKEKIRLKKDQKGEKKETIIIAYCPS